MKTLKMISLSVLACFIMGSTSCGGLKYEADTSFKNSSQANSPEFPVSVNGSLCKDMDSKVGLCAKRIDSDEPVLILHPARPYAYVLNVECTPALDFELDEAHVPKETPFTVTIPVEKFEQLLDFTCEGEIFPEDRLNKISSFWHVRVVVYDVEYEPRETVYHFQDKGKDRIVMGKYSKHVTVCKEGICRNFKEKTILKEDPSIQAYSESELGRFNYWNM